MRWRPMVWCALLLLVGAPGPGCGEQAGAAQDAREQSAPAPFAGANLIIISIDTLRADSVSWLGGPPGLTEAFDELARQSVVFTQARAAAPQTAPSHMSLFTGVRPSVHGVQNVQHGIDPETGHKQPLIERLPDEIPTLAEVLHAAGYATVGLTDGGNLNPPHGFDRGFDEYTYQLAGAAAKVADARQWLPRLRAGSSPFFLFLHTYEVHSPYVAPAEYLARWAPDDYHGLMRERVERVAAMPFAQAFGSMRTVYWRNKQTFGQPEADYLHGVYLAGIDHTDDLFSSLLDDFAADGTLADSIVVLVGDHGEEFFEHGQWQHDQLYEECLRVPLLVHLPGGLGAGRRIDVPVGLIDVMPTLLQLLGVSRVTPEAHVRVPMRGVSFASALVDGGDPRPRPILSEYRADRKGSPLYDWQIAFQFQDHKFIYDQYRQQHWWGPGKADKSWRDHWLFDLRADPDERVNLAPDAGRAGPLLALFNQQLQAYSNELQAVGDLRRVEAGQSLDAEQLEQLIELGYIDASAAGH